MAGRYAASPSSERRTAWIILGIGTAISVASMLGGVWIVRFGVVAAIAMACLAVAVAWRQLDLERAKHRAQIKEQIALRVALTSKHHADSMAMIDRFSARSDNLKTLIANLRRQLAQANSELSTMRGNAVWLRAEVAERQATIEALTARLAVEEAGRESALVALPGEGVNASEHMWDTGEHPTVVDLQRLQADGIPELRLEA